MSLFLISLCNIVPGPGPDTVNHPQPFCTDEMWHMCYHVCHWKEDLLLQLIPQLSGHDVDMQGFPTNQIHFLFHRVKAPVKWGLYQQPFGLSLCSGFILCCFSLAGGGNGSIFRSCAESSLAHCHGSHIQLMSSLKPMCFCAILNCNSCIQCLFEEKKIKLDLFIVFKWSTL